MRFHRYRVVVFYRLRGLKSLLLRFNWMTDYVCILMGHTHRDKLAWHKLLPEANCDNHN